MTVFPNQVYSLIITFILIISCVEHARLFELQMAYDLYTNPYHSHCKVGNINKQYSTLPRQLSVIHIMLSVREIDSAFFCSDFDFIRIQKMINPFCVTSRMFPLMKKIWMTTGNCFARAVIVVIVCQQTNYFY